MLKYTHEENICEKETMHNKDTRNFFQKRKLLCEKSSKFHDIAANKSRYYTQVIAAVAVSFGPLAVGLGKGYTSPAIANIQELQIRHKNNSTLFSVSDQQASWIAALSLLGALCGGLCGGIVLQFGRKRVLAVIALPYSITWISTIFAQSVTTMLLTAFISGYCCSVVTMTTQVYVSEISSPEIRGFLSAIQKVSGHFGVLVSFLSGVYLNWRQLALVVSIAPIMLFLTVIYIPESPSYLVLKGKSEDAYRSLEWLRGSDKSVVLELETLKTNVQAFLSAASICEKSYINNMDPFKRFRDWIAKSQKVFKNERFVKSLTITCGLMVFHRFTGVNSFSFYAVNTLKQTFVNMNAHGGAVAVAFVQLLASMLSGLLIDVVGRVPLLIFSSVFMSLALACFGSYVFYDQSNRASTTTHNMEFFNTNMDWIPLLCVLVFAIAFSLEEQLMLLRQQIRGQDELLEYMKRMTEAIEAQAETTKILAAAIQSQADASHKLANAISKFIGDM